MSAEMRARVAAVHERIREARSRRANQAVTLVAVSKTREAHELIAYSGTASEIGIPVVFGENYVQEWKGKQSIVGAADVHLIGPLQSNKARDAVHYFSMVESVHSEKIARALDSEARKAEKILPVLLQVNISSDAAKSGFSPEELEGFLVSVAEGLDALSIRGLMTITALYDDPEQARPDFVRMRELLSRLQANSAIPQGVREGLRELSMGMSGDYEVAIEEGATIVRIGTALFGERG